MAEGHSMKIVNLDDGGVENSYNPHADPFLKDGHSYYIQKKKDEPDVDKAAETSVVEKRPVVLDEHGNPIEVDDTPLTGIWLMIDKYFLIRERGTTIKNEFYTGIIQFISCLYVLPVVPQQMARAAYDRESSIVATALCCAVGCIIASVLTNLPFIVAPPTSVSIFLAVYLQQHGQIRAHGNVAVVISGCMLVLIGYRPLGRFVAKCIPGCIQASTSVGIGLITALAGATEISLVIHGKYTILDMGDITPEVIIAMMCLVLVAICLHYHVKGAFCIGLVTGTLIWWFISGEYPEGFASIPHTDEDNLTSTLVDSETILLVFNLVFLYTLTLNGLARSLSDLGKLTEADGAVPNGRWLYIVCGFTTMLSGFISGPPILISPESAAGIKAGAKTGFSTLICGLFFALSCFFTPIFHAVPAAGTAPLLLMVGVVLFGNVTRLNFAVYKESVPAYCCLFFIPFTYSILRGVGFGYVTYAILGIFTGDLLIQLKAFWQEYKTIFNKDEMKNNLGHILSNPFQWLLKSFDVGHEDIHTSFDDVLKSPQPDDVWEVADNPLHQQEQLKDLPEFHPRRAFSNPQLIDNEFSPSSPIADQIRRNTSMSGNNDRKISFERTRSPSYGIPPRERGNSIYGSNNNTRDRNSSISMMM